MLARPWDVAVRPRDVPVLSGFHPTYGLVPDMEYKFTPGHENYAPYASGGVFHSAPGRPAFPVRLANEVFRRCLHWRAAAGGAQPGSCVLYDPCCGGAYHLATLAYFNWAQIGVVYASDIDADALGVAARNLALLAPSGLAQRVGELDAMHRQWGKESHAAAHEHAQALQARLAALHAGHAIATHLFCADATDGAAVRAGLAGAKIDVVIADAPYGRASQWQGAAEGHSGGGGDGDGAGEGGAEAATPLPKLLEVLLPSLAAGALVAVAAAKGDKIRHAAYRRLERFTVGRRQVVILQPLPVVR